MVDKIKVYKPTTIEDTPFPNQEEESFDTSQKTSDGDYSNVTIKSQPVPRLATATEIISTALNTISKKITTAFEFTQKGAIQIGNYLNGTTGDIRISPDGITARDVTGETTFALDGTTGDATFKGEVQAGSILTGGVTITDDSGTTIIDGSGLVSTNNFTSGTDGYTGAGNLSVVGGGTWSAWTDIHPDLNLDFTLSRSAVVQFYFTGGIEFFSNATTAGHLGEARMALDGNQVGGVIIKSTGLSPNTTARGEGETLINISTVGAGSHTLKAQFRAYQGTTYLLGTTWFDLPAGTTVSQIGLVVLGN